MARRKLLIATKLNDIIIYISKFVNLIRDNTNRKPPKIIDIVLSETTQILYVAKKISLFLWVTIFTIPKITSSIEKNKYSIDSLRNTFADPKENINEKVCARNHPNV